MYTTWIKPLLAASLDLIYPRVCTCCGSVLLPDEQQICPSCSTSLTHIQHPICSICGSPVRQDKPKQKRCYNCPPNPIHFDKACAMLDYHDEAVRRMIHTFKYAYIETMAAGLSPFLVEGFQQNYANENVDFIVPVPLHKRRERQREFN